LDGIELPCIAALRVADDLLAGGDLEVARRDTGGAEIRALGPVQHGERGVPAAVQRE
jgi:hypothetical protein